MQQPSTKMTMPNAHGLICGGSTRQHCVVATVGKYNNVTCTIEERAVLHKLVEHVKQPDQYHFVRNAIRRMSGLFRVKLLC